MEPSSPSATDSAAARQTLGLPSFAAAAAAAAPTDPPVKKKPRRAGFREQFLQQLRVMLDRESQNNSTAVQWSADGSSFIIMDQLEFEKHIIPTYFDNPIMFSSFLSKLSRWGFRRIPNERSGCYEFCLPTFKRLGVDGAPASAATRGADSIQIQLPQINQQAWIDTTLQLQGVGTFSPTPLASLSPPPVLPSLLPALSSCLPNQNKSLNNMMTSASLASPPSPSRALHSGVSEFKNLGDAEEMRNNNM